MAALAPRPGLARQILASPDDRSPIRRLNAIDARQWRLLDKAPAYIEAHCDDTLFVGGIAREVGLSVSVFQSSSGARSAGASMPTFSRSASSSVYRAPSEGRISVAEASALAGYSAPANFATAFRRRYGLTPREARGPRPDAGDSPASPRYDRPLRLQSARSLSDSARSDRSDGYSTKTAL